MPNSFVTVLFAASISIKKPGSVPEKKQSEENYMEVDFVDDMRMVHIIHANTKKLCMVCLLIHVRTWVQNLYNFFSMLMAYGCREVKSSCT